MNKRKPRRFCGEGHEMTEANTYLHDDSRHCRECRKISSQERAKRNAEKRKEAKLAESPVAQDSES